MCVLSRVQLFVPSMDSNLPGPFVYGIFQARILQRLPFPTTFLYTNVYQGGWKRCSKDNVIHNNTFHVTVSSTTLWNKLEGFISH